MRRADKGPVAIIQFAVSVQVLETEAADISGSVCLCDITLSKWLGCYNIGYGLIKTILLQPPEFRHGMSFCRTGYVSFDARTASL